MKINRLASAEIPTEFGQFQICAFGENDNDYTPHLALIKGDVLSYESVLVRIHSECITGDLFGSKRCDCGDQLKNSIKRIGKEGGVILYLREEGRGIGIVNKLKAYNLQDEGMNTVEANEALGFPIDRRDFKSAIQILRSLKIKRIKLLTNNPDKIKVFDEYDIDVISRERLIIPPCLENYKYLKTKQEEMGHLLNMSE